MDTVTSATDGRELRSVKVKQRLRAGLRLQRQQIAAIRNKLNRSSTTPVSRQTIAGLPTFRESPLSTSLIRISMDTP
jgi:hypothetical protein